MDARRLSEAMYQSGRQRLLSRSRWHALIVNRPSAFGKQGVASRPDPGPRQGLINIEASLAHIDGALGR